MSSTFAHPLGSRVARFECTMFNIIVGSNDVDWYLHCSCVELWSGFYGNALKCTVPDEPSYKRFLDWTLEPLKERALLIDLGARTSLLLHRCVPMEVTRLLPGDTTCIAQSPTLSWVLPSGAETPLKG